MQEVNKGVNPLKEGQQVPDFLALDDSGVSYSNKNLLGTDFIIYFYPRDNTPGCTLQACDIRDSYKEIKQNSLKIFGVSGCSLQAHKKFKAKYSLPFPILLDEENKLAKSFGVWGEKRFMGKTFDGIHRTTFWVNKSGVILKTYPKVKRKLHINMILKYLRLVND